MVVASVSVLWADYWLDFLTVGWGVCFGVGIVDLMVAGCFLGRLLVIGAWFGGRCLVGLCLVVCYCLLCLWVLFVVLLRFGLLVVFFVLCLGFDGFGFGLLYLLLAGGFRGWLVCWDRGFDWWWLVVAVVLCGVGCTYDCEFGCLRWFVLAGLWVLVRGFWWLLCLLRWWVAYDCGLNLVFVM